MFVCCMRAVKPSLRIGRLLNYSHERTASLPLKLRCLELTTMEPPTYSQLPDTQLIIIPSSNSIQFQDGFLGVDETSSVEGEVHVKGAIPGDWNKLYDIGH